MSGMACTTRRQEGELAGDAWFPGHQRGALACTETKHSRSATNRFLELFTLALLIIIIHTTFVNPISDKSAFPGLSVSFLQSAYRTLFAYVVNQVTTFKYLGSLETNQNSIQDEIKCSLKAGNACYYSVQTLLSS